MKQILCWSLLLFTSIACLAQGTTSRISGVATDSTGAVVSGAVITATNEDTAVTYSTKTSASGTYSFDSLQIGHYTLRAEATGFRQFVSTGNVLAIGVPTSIDPKFQIGGTTESVQVEGGYDLVQTESSGNFGAVIDNTTLTQLPIVQTRGRSPLALTQYIPGVVQNNSANAPGGDIVVNGSRDRAFNYVLDGIDDNETSSGGSNTSPSHQNPDMLAEFRVITSNPTAEFGRNSGAQVLMVTKSGTNKFHGNGFWFYQSPFLQANTAAAKAISPPPSPAVCPEHLRRLSRRPNLEGQGVLLRQCRTAARSHWYSGHPHRLHSSGEERSVPLRYEPERRVSRMEMRRRPSHRPQLRLSMRTEIPFFRSAHITSQRTIPSTLGSIRRHRRFSPSHPCPITSQWVMV